jgi:hypothetical protein
LCFSFVTTSFYQNNVLLDYSFKMSEFIYIWGYVWMHSGRHVHVVIIDFQPVGRKSDHKEGGILGTEMKNLFLTFSQLKQIINPLPGGPRSN